VVERFHRRGGIDYADKESPQRMTEILLSKPFGTQLDDLRRNLQKAAVNPARQGKQISV
jgi:hypothetical protein